MAQSGTHNENSHQSGSLSVTIHVWRQASRDVAGRFVTYKRANVSPDMSFLEMLDVLNRDLVAQGEPAVAFEHDCREGICGSCSMMINGEAHGPLRGVTACQLHMRTFRDGDEIYIEPWRARAFPVLKDLVVDRSGLDRIIQAGGYISVNTGSAQDANSLPVAKSDADSAFDAATCIGCGACVAACPNGSAMLFTSAKITHLGLLPQGQPERAERARSMVAAMDKNLFGACTNHGECEDACPKQISVACIAQLNRDYIAATLLRREPPPSASSDSI